MVQQFVLFESASGYALFDIVEAEEIGATVEEVQAAALDAGRFGNMVKLKAFKPFLSAEDALDNCNCVSEGLLHDTLKVFLEMNLPKVKEGKKAKFSLGVYEPKIGQVIGEELNIPCKVNETIAEVLRGIRLHFSTFIRALQNGGWEKAQLGLGHSYSRAKVKYNVHRADNMIIQSISLADQLDKDLNTFSMRMREWYSWHFPELNKIVGDHYVFARVAQAIGDKHSITEIGEAEAVALLEPLTMDEDVARAIIHAAKSSMGMDMSEIDMRNVMHFTQRVIRLGEFRKGLGEYLTQRMHAVAPSTSALIGETVAARLIAHAGSLTNLAKAPASTVQILGAEKALFRALKTRGNTPKYGLIFHSSFIGRAAAKNKGRISRYLANKVSIASRIDCFSDEPTAVYGNKLRDQVEERLAFYDNGATPRKNIDVMEEVAGALRAASATSAEVTEETDGKKSKKKDKKEKKKRKRDEDEEEEEVPAEEEKKQKKKKKKVAEEVEPASEEEEKKKKKKKDKKSKKASA